MSNERKKGTKNPTNLLPVAAGVGLVAVTLLASNLSENNSQPIDLGPTNDLSNKYEVPPTKEHIEPTPIFSEETQLGHMEIYFTEGEGHPESGVAMINIDPERLEDDHNSLLEVINNQENFRMEGFLSYQEEKGISVAAISMAIGKANEDEPRDKFEQIMADENNGALSGDHMLIITWKDWKFLSALWDNQIIWLPPTPKEDKA